MMQFLLLWNKINFTIKAFCSLQVAILYKWGWFLHLSYQISSSHHVPLSWKIGQWLSGMLGKKTTSKKKKNANLLRFQSQSLHYPPHCLNATGLSWGAARHLHGFAVAQFRLSYCTLQCSDNHPALMKWEEDGRPHLQKQFRNKVF